MGLTSSDLLEELMYEAHSLGVADQLRDMVSKSEMKPRPTAYDMLPVYEEAFKHIKKSLDKST